MEISLLAYRSLNYPNRTTQKDQDFTWIDQLVALQLVALQFYCTPVLIPVALNNVLK